MGTSFTLCVVGLVAFGIWIVATVACCCVLAGRADRLIEASDDSGQDRDAGVKHVCWHCGKRLDGPVDGMLVPDLKCWQCHCARYVSDDDVPSVPSYVRGYETEVRL